MTGREIKRSIEEYQPSNRAKVATMEVFEVGIFPTLLTAPAKDQVTVTKGEEIPWASEELMAKTTSSLKYSLHFVTI